ncbi:MAG: hypothetical protein B6D40_06905, partial [Anaerolineae bacterium UTCFX3]
MNSNFTTQDAAAQKKFPLEFFQFCRYNPDTFVLFKTTMPINYQEVYARIREIGQGARQRRQALDERRALARQLIEAFDGQLDLLRAKVDA